MTETYEEASMPEHPTTVVLDREQRQALRRELRLAALDCGDINIALRRGEREFVLERLELLAGIAAVLDAIGWEEEPGAPDHQPVTIPPAAVRWLAGNADQLARSLQAETAWEDLDSDLLALHTMRLLTATGEVA